IYTLSLHDALPISEPGGCILSSEHLERRLAAILAADVVGSCRLVGIDEEGTLAQLKALRKTLFDPKIAQHHGRIVKNTGGGALVEFAQRGRRRAMCRRRPTRRGRTKYRCAAGQADRISHRHSSR